MGWQDLLYKLPYQHVTLIRLFIKQVWRILKRLSFPGLGFDFRIVSGANFRSILGVNFKVVVGINFGVVLGVNFGVVFRC